MNTLKQTIEKFYEEDNHEGIIDFIDTIIITTENKPYLYSELGRAYNNLGNNSDNETDAHNFFLKALKLLLETSEIEGNNNANTQYRMAYSYWRLAKFDNNYLADAWKTVSHSLSLKPNHQSAIYVKENVWSEIVDGQLLKHYPLLGLSPQIIELPFDDYNQKYQEIFEPYKKSVSTNEYEEVEYPEEVKHQAECFKAMHVQLPNPNLIYVTLNINEKLMPIERGDLYEDPLNNFLMENNFGETTGGGTAQQQNGEIESIDVELDLYVSQNSTIADLKKSHGKMLTALIDKINSLGIPKGSKFILDVEDFIEVGTKEGIGVYFSFDGLEKGTIDFNEVFKDLKKITQDNPEVARYCETQDFLALYFYGDSFEIMKKNVVSYLTEKYPILKYKTIQFA
jgi:hypothetical protein